MLSSLPWRSSRGGARCERTPLQVTDIPAASRAQESLMHSCIEAPSSRLIRGGRGATSGPSGTVARMHELTEEALVAASVDRVWDDFTQAGPLGEWIWPPRFETEAVVEAEP